MPAPVEPGIYIEITIQGNFAKVTAIDAATGIEASIIGPASAPRDSLNDLAVRKLQYVMKKKGDDPIAP